MFLSVTGCAEPMTQLCKLKVILQGHVIYPSIHVRSISRKPFQRFSLNFTQMFLLVRRWAKHMTQLRTNGQGHRSWSVNLSFNSVSVPYLNSLRFSLNFTQMFLIVRRCTEHMTQLPSLNPLNDFHYFSFYLILYVPSTILQLCRDQSSWVEPVLS